MRSLGQQRLGVRAGVYLGDEGLRHYLRVSQFEYEVNSPVVMDTMKAISAQLADRNQLDIYDLNVINELGLRYRRHRRWPAFRSLRPGYAP